MSQSERPYWMQIQILKEKIEKLLLEKRVLRFSNADIEKREIEKRDLYVIKNTLQFLKEENRLNNTYELPIAEKLTAAKLYSSKTDRRSAKIPIVVIVMLVLCALTVFSEYYGAAEPPVRCGESHLSGLTEPPIDSYSA